MQFHLQSNLGSYFLCTGALASQNTLKGWEGGGDTDLHQFLVERKNSGTWEWLGRIALHTVVELP